MKKKEKYEIRLPVLEKYKPVWLTREAHTILRNQKRRQGESMAQIVNNLILEKYGKNKISLSGGSVKGDDAVFGQD